MWLKQASRLCDGFQTCNSSRRVTGSEACWPGVERRDVTNSDRASQDIQSTLEPEAGDLVLPSTCLIRGKPIA